MASGMRAARTITRRFASAAEALDKSATKGPKLPAGNDPSAYHSKLHAVADSNRWKMVSLAFGVPVVGFGILQSMGTHEHAPPPPNYDYLKRATRTPRFPWGDDDLIGTPHDRAVRRGEEH